MHKNRHINIFYKNKHVFAAGKHANGRAKFLLCKKKINYVSG